MKQALKAFEKANIYTGSNDLVMRVTVKLLARQHRAMVRLVQNVRNTPNPNSYADANTYTAWHQEVCDKILAALGKRKGGKK